MKKPKNKLDLKIVDFLFLTIAGIINAVGVGLILTPSGLLDGGLSGTSIAIGYIAEMKLSGTIVKILPSILLIVLNFPFYIIAYKKLGLKSVIYSLYAISIYSLTLLIFRSTIDLSTSPITKDDILLAAIFGGLTSGVGSGLTIRKNAALDGIEVCSILFSKKVGLSTGQFVMAYNAILFIIFGFIMGFEIPLYSCIAYYVGLKVIDIIAEGLDKTKMLLIITTKVDEVTNVISTRFNRQMTLIHAKGYYLKDEKQIIYSVCNRFEVTGIKNAILEVDENAFITISEVSETVGKKIKKSQKDY